MRGCEFRRSAYDVEHRETTAVRWTSPAIHAASALSPPPKSILVGGRSVWCCGCWRSQHDPKRSRMAAVGTPTPARHASRRLTPPHSIHVGGQTVRWCGGPAFRIRLQALGASRWAPVDRGEIRLCPRTTLRSRRPPGAPLPLPYLRTGEVRAVLGSARGARGLVARGG